MVCLITNVQKQMRSNVSSSKWLEQVCPRVWLWGSWIFPVILNEETWLLGINSLLRVKSMKGKWKSIKDILMLLFLVFFSLFMWYIKHKEECFIVYPNTDGFLNQLQSVWISDGTLFPLFEVASQSINNSLRNSKQKFTKCYHNKDHISKLLHKMYPIPYAEFGWRNSTAKNDNGKLKYCLRCPRISRFPCCRDCDQEGRKF